MTPDQARALLDGAAPGPWEVDESDHHVWAIGPIDGSANGSELCCQITDARLAAHAPDMAAMIAGMREEWVGQYLEREGKWATICAYPAREEVAHHLDHGCWDAYTHTRIVRRYVTEPEEIK